MSMQQTRSSEGSLFNRSISRLKELWQSFPLTSGDETTQYLANQDLDGSSIDVLRGEMH
ncbi:MAG: hypothetical protein GY918_09255, partial [Gammaproteobacteria bacterium]|nr:hypothetical protein [Gammaproteobacteria bacterium]